ncbi:MAG: hypothetical protein L6Q33_00465 [Bacteriovoracaceae bacterium]|nr:hypothetical protein [Bacteriovoracaceae bacterium]
MNEQIELLKKYQIEMSWIILEYNVCYFADSDFAGRYRIHPSWWKNRRINDSDFDNKFAFFVNLSNFLGEQIINEPGFDPNRPSVQIVLDKMSQPAKDTLIWPTDAESLFESFLVSLKSA